MAAGHVIVVVVVALLGGGVLNAQALTDAAARQPFGWKRTVAVVAATPFRGIAGLTSLDQPHRMLSRVASGAVGESQAVAPAPPPSEPAMAPTPTAPAPTDVPSEPPTETAETRGPPTRRDPLRVWVGGDSLTSEFAPALSDRLARTQRGEAQVEFRFSTGLARPDFFNWPARLKQIVARQDPDVFVVMFGANDGQNLSVDGTVLEFGTPAWSEEYAGRVQSVLDILTGDGRTVYWIGQPVMADAAFDRKMQYLNDIYRAEVRDFDAATYVDSRSLFAGDDGGFASYLEDANGQSTLMRQQDGVHFTRAGGERLTTVVFEALDEQWGITAGSP